MYEAQKCKVTAEVAGTSLPVERELWHGTDTASVLSICSKGFNRSYAGKNGELSGWSNYFLSNKPEQVKFFFGRT